MSSFFCHGHSGLPLPLCCDGLALLEQGLHALSFGVSLLASVFLFTWLLLSLWLNTCSCKTISLFRFFLHYWCQICQTLWPSFIIGADIVGRNGDFVLKADRLPVNETQLCVCLFVFDFLIKSDKSVTSPMQRPRQRHFTPLGRNLLTASASRARTQPCQSPSRGAKSGHHNDMLIRWTCRNTHLTLDPSDNNHNNVTQYLFHFFAHLAIVLQLFNIFRTSWWCLLTIHHNLFLYYMCDYSS